MELVSGNIFIRPNPMSKGDETGGHEHNFDHTTIVFKGAIHVIAEKDGVTLWEKEFKAPAHFLVKADVRHNIVATEDNTEMWCVYSHRTPQGDVVQECTGYEDAYR